MIQKVAKNLLLNHICDNCRFGISDSYLINEDYVCLNPIRNTVANDKYVICDENGIIRDIRGTCEYWKD